MRERFDQLRAMGIRTVMITGDNPLTAAAIAAEAGVDDFLAEATPEDKMALIKREQAGGNLVAMTGDGTNDAPALAQADVGVAMNTGTQAAKEAGNMVDLDSNPTKLIEIVEVGKQLLITRGSLTTFSIANDVAKYFAIIPAMFSGVIPALDSLNVMDLHSPRSAILSAVIFNALIIVALVPLALRGVKFVAESAAAVLRRNLLIYGLGGVVAPFVGIKIIDVIVVCAGSEVTCDVDPSTPPRPADGRRLHGAHGRRLPPRRHRVVAGRFNHEANGSLVEPRRRRVVVGSELIGQNFTAPEYFHPRPSAAGDGYDGAASSGSNLGPRNPDLLAAVDERVRRRTARRTVCATDVARAGRRRHGLGLRARPAHLRRQRPAPGARVAEARDLDVDVVNDVIDEHTAGAAFGFLGEPAVNVCSLNLALDEIWPSSRDRTRRED